MRSTRFLLARLHTESLQDAVTPRDVMSALDQLSRGLSGLGDAYRKVIDKIEGQHPRHHVLAKKLLSWITFAKRPLTTIELCHALAVVPGDSKLDPSNIPETDDLVSVCAGLVIYDEQRDVIRLVHYTTQKYLEDISNSWEPSPQLLITTACLTYLSFDAFKTGRCSSQLKLRWRHRHHKLFDYAAKFWGDHARTVETTLVDLASSFLLQDPLLLSAIQGRKPNRNTFCSLREFEVPQYSILIPLQQTAEYGLPVLARKILSTTKEDVAKAVNAKNSHGYTALMIAAVNGHSSMVELLLDHGAEIHVRSSYGASSNALWKASETGQEHIVKLLLDKKADVNAKDSRSDPALTLASRAGHNQIVELLLSSGADINASTEHTGTALQGALSVGNKDTVMLLVKAGADVNSSPRWFGNALWVALNAGYMDIAKLLLAHGAIAVEPPSHLLRRAAMAAALTPHYYHSHPAIAAASRPKGRRSASVEISRLPAPKPPTPYRMSLSDVLPPNDENKLDDKETYAIPPYSGTARTPTEPTTTAPTSWSRLTATWPRRLLMLPIFVLIMFIFWLLP
jgi:ankyrin repeat protein